MFATVAGLLGATWLATQLMLAGIGAVGICLLGAWARFGRGIVPLSALLAAPLYIAWKVPMYFAFLFKRQTEWNHTARAATGQAMVYRSFFKGFVAEMKPAANQGDYPMRRSIPLMQEASASHESLLVSSRAVDDISDPEAR